MGIIIFFLLAAYGICFAIQNKLAFLHGKYDMLDKFLGCPYCVGFHCGWIVYLLHTDSFIALQCILWAFASSAFCYIIDISAQLIESKT